jgi:pyruvyltransferase
MGFLATIKPSIKQLIFRNRVPVFWSKTKNWGDALNPYLIEKLAGKTARFETDPYTHKYQVIGSILHRADANTIVWGSGFISASSMWPQRPKDIIATRGELSLAKIRDATSRNDPIALGDPAILIPFFYSPDIKMTAKCGIVAHVTDKNHSWIEKVRGNPDIKIIDIEQGIESFIDEMLACEVILSSSLHGLICADAFGIPRLRLILNGLLEGGDFKFNDYHTTVSPREFASLKPTLDTTIGEVLPLARRFDIAVSQENLLSVCPFV